MNDKAILYIEDNFHNRRIVRKILTVNGYSVVEAGDGITGLQKIQELKPPLVLLDIALPGMDGMEIAQRVKADEHLQDVPLVALTASAMRGDRERFLAAGCDGYLSKPFKAEELVEVVKNYYNSSNGKLDSLDNGSQRDGLQPLLVEAPEIQAGEKAVDAMNELENKSEREPEVEDTNLDLPVEIETGETDLPLDGDGGVEFLPESEDVFHEEVEVDDVAEYESGEDAAATAEVEMPEDLIDTIEAETEFEDSEEDEADAIFDGKFVDRIVERLEFIDVAPPDVDGVEVDDPEIAHQNSFYGPKTILIIDDNMWDARLLRRLFEAQKYSVEVASDGESALKYLESHVPSAILLDLILPDTGGEQLLTVIRANETTASVPVVVVSVKELEPKARQELEKQADSVWSKELLDYRALFAHVERLMLTR